MRKVCMQLLHVLMKLHVAPGVLQTSYDARPDGCHWNRTILSVRCVETPMSHYHTWPNKYRTGAMLFFKLYLNFTGHLMFSNSSSTSQSIIRTEDGPSIGIISRPWSTKTIMDNSTIFQAPPHAAYFLWSCDKCITNRKYAFFCIF